MCENSSNTCDRQSHNSRAKLRMNLEGGSATVCQTVPQDETPSFESFSFDCPLSGNAVIDYQVSQYGCTHAAMDKNSSISTYCLAGNMSQPTGFIDASDQSIHVEFADWCTPTHTVCVGNPLLQVHPSIGSHAHGDLTLITQPCTQHHVLYSYLRGIITRPFPMQVSPDMKRPATFTRLRHDQKANSNAVNRRILRHL
jgi:hypothetical protein